MLRLVFCLFLLRVTVVTTKESCDTQSVAEGQPSAVTCHFSQDLNATRVHQFTVDRYDLDEPIGIDSRRIVLECYWPKEYGDLTCTEDPNYAFDLKVSDSLTLKIPNASKIHVGKYVCQVVGWSDSDPCVFRLKESETTPSGRTKGTSPPLVTPSTTESINPNGTGIPPEEAQTANLPMIVGIVVAAVVVAAVVIVVIAICVRRKRTTTEVPTTKDNETPADAVQLEEANEVKPLVENPDQGDVTAERKDDVTPGATGDEDKDNEKKPLVNQENTPDENDATPDNTDHVTDDVNPSPPEENSSSHEEETPDPTGDENAPLKDKD